MKKSLFLVFVLISIFGIGQELGDIPAKPHPARLVNNFSKEFPNFLSKKESKALEFKLQDFAKKTSNQIVIVIVDDLKGYEPGEFAMNLGNLWGVGQKEKDNGIVILVKPTGTAGDRKVQISVGLGLETIITDSYASEIVEKTLIPNFKLQEYYIGLDSATTLIMNKLN
ncbi:MAG: TPM domain-containing protein [Bacteroidota bacterium]